MRIMSLRTKALLLLGAVIVCLVPVSVRYMFGGTIEQMRLAVVITLGGYLVLLAVTVGAVVWRNLVR
jgi:hypothetical protein